MSLSADLISQFAKITKNKEETKKETTVYGTIVEYNGSNYVKLDGSDLLTPISTTTDTQSGERVTVMIKNHTATVTGNISSPAARTDDVQEIGNKITDFEIVVADKVSTKQFDAQVGRIDNLVTETTTIKKELNATNANIENLNSTYASIEDLKASNAEIDKLKTTKLDADIADVKYATIEKLDATNAKINNLDTVYATIEKLDATNATINNLDSKYAKIENLNASNARITNLEANSLTADSAVIKDLKADVADIDTLIFGSATGDVIQTSFANAVIAQLGNAQIKSAMIDTVSADKIQSGSIVTNNVTVTSSDGKLLIADETIQIKDANRTRVQIGKDASGDYSINIWDADGKLMFSKGGLTEDAIKDAIIRDDMVSDTANISAGKLNISSLFKVINEDGTNTLNSSKIAMDTEGQTLDVAFTSMSGDIKSQGTAISAIQGQISSKVWQQDINEAKGEMSTQYSSLEQSVDSFKASVSSTYATKDEVDAIEIGARNLLPDTDFKGVSKRYEKLEGAATEGGFHFYPTIPIEKDVEYTLSVDIRGKANVVFYEICSEGGNKSHVFITKSEIDEEEYQRFSITFTVDTTRVFQNVYICTQWGDTNTLTGDWFEIKPSSLKLEKGNKATDWTPAPEDVSSAITNAQNTASSAHSRIASAESTIAVHTEQIALSATKKELEGYSTISETEAKINVATEAITTQVSSKYATKEALATTDAKIQTTADSITSSVKSTYATKDEVNSIEIGGRNLLVYGTILYAANTGHKDLIADTTTGLITGTGQYYLQFDVELEPNTEYTIHVERIETSGGDYDSYIYARIYDHTAGDTIQSIGYLYSGNTITFTTFGTVTTAHKLLIYSTGATETVYLIDRLKLEKGNKATDWSPAPEDMATAEDAENAQKTADVANEKADTNSENITIAESEIKQLSDGISMLVTDGSGSSLMTQTENGWTFSTAKIQSDINNVSENMGTIQNKLGDTEATVGVLQQAVSDIGAKTDYVTISQYTYTNENGETVTEPCIELGEVDKPYKLLITNTQILFKVGSAIPTRINSKGLVTENITVENEFRLLNPAVNGYYFASVRANGNYGEQWVEGVQ